MVDFNPEDESSRVAPDQSERARRDSLFLLAEVIRESGQPAGNARIRNLSATGLMADCETMFRRDDRLVFDLRNIGPVAGTVAWAEGQRVGVRFDREIDPQAARKPVGTDPGKGIPLYVRYLGIKTPPPKRS